MDNIYLTNITTLHWFLYAPATISSTATATIIHHLSVTKYLFTWSLYLNQSKCITIPIQKGDCREGDTKWEGGREEIGGVCYCYLNNSFQCLNNITRIFTRIFTHMYFHKITTTLLIVSYQTGPKFLYIPRWKEGEGSGAFKIFTSDFVIFLVLGL